MTDNASLPHEPTPPAPADAPLDEPDRNAVLQYLLYTCSLPERALRSSVSIVGGAAREATSLLTPRAFQNSRTYRVMIRQTLDFLVEDIGGVARAESDEAPAKIDNFVARKAVGNFVETASFLTFHISPLTVLAIVSDVAYGSTAYLRELSAELKKQGLIAEDSTIERADDLLEAVANASGAGASVFDTPPLSVEGLKQTIAQTRQAVAKMDPTSIIPQAEIGRMWQEMHDIAEREQMNIFAVSGAMTMSVIDKIGSLGKGVLSSVRVAGDMFDRHVIGHYATALAEVRELGVYGTLQKCSGPYIEAVWRNFAGNRDTLTEGLLSGRIFVRMWRWLIGCFRRRPSGT